MIKEILTYPKNKEILELKSEEITDINDEIKTLAQDLIDTLNMTKTGVGISAIQIGVPKKMCVIKYNNEVYYMINPVITRTRGEQIVNEGCLSAPDTFIDVTRAQKVWCEYTDLDGGRREISQGGLFSAIVQHELDHFEGGCEVFKGITNNKVEIKEIKKGV